MLDTTGIRFEQAAPLQTTAPNRADVACFIGFVPRSRKFSERLPESLVRWLRTQGLIDAPGMPAELDADGRPTPRVIELEQLPVPIDSWSTFLDLFEEPGRPARPDTADPVGTTYLGAAVRSFFAQGGRKCFVVRAGDPIPTNAPLADRLELIGALLPEWEGDLAALSPEAPPLWRGIAHLFGLEEASCVCMPDLPWLLAEVPPRVPPEPRGPARPEYFVECSDDELLEPIITVDPLGAPRLDAEGLRGWGRAVNMAARFLAGGGPSKSRRDVQLIVALPLAASGSDAEHDVLDALVNGGLFERLHVRAEGVSSAHVQLAYPWLGWQGSTGLPGGLEPPDGALAGVIARGTLLHGAFTSFADLELRHVERLEPVSSLAQIASVRRRNLEPAEGNEARFLSLRQRVSLFGFGVDGIQLLSDVTTCADEAWRPANVNRLMSVWVRALRRAGEDFVFEPSSELTWINVRQRLQFIGETLFRNGALRGRNPREAFAVRCDRTTMSNSDIDGGRLIAEVQFRPALPIDGIVISLALDEAQRLSIRQQSFGREVA